MKGMKDLYVPETKTIYVWENQRKKMFFGDFSKDGLLSTERGPYNDEKGECSSPLEYPLPSSGEYIKKKKKKK